MVAEIALDGRPGKDALTTASGVVWSQVIYLCGEDSHDGC